MEGCYYVSLLPIITLE